MIYYSHMPTGLLRRLLDVSGELVAVVDCVTGVLLDCNDTVCANSGRTRDELIGQRLLDLRITFPMQTEEQWSTLVARVEAAAI